MSKILLALILIFSYNALGQNKDFLSSIHNCGVAHVFELNDAQAYEIYTASNHWDIKSDYLTQ